MPQLRQNFITGDWVVIAPERAKRPNEYVTPDTVKKQPKAKCPFCPGKPAYQTRIKEYDTPHTYLIRNKYPAYVESKKEISPRAFKVENRFYRVREAIGGHDVQIIKDHDLDLPKFPKEVWMELFEAAIRRFNFFRKEKGNEYTMWIYNHGPEAGASIEHPHAQIFSSPIIPNVISKELEHTQNYYEENGRCAFCDMLAHEKQEKVRIVAENSHFLAFTFFAARFPFEVWLLPKEHQTIFEHITRPDLEALAEIIREVLTTYDKALNDPPLNIYLHNIPHTIGETHYYHWHLEFAPRLTGYGGYELGSGVIIDVYSPEEAAKFLRGKK